MSTLKANPSHRQQQHEPIHPDTSQPSSPYQPPTLQTLSPTSSPRHPPTSQSQPITFGTQSVSLKCPFCLQRTRTQIVMKPQLISIMLALMLFTLIPNAIMIVIIVIVLQVTATKRHRCSLCQRQLGTDGKFLIVFTDQVYSWSFGETGILVSKKILITILLFLFTILLIFVRSNATQSYDWIQLSWKQLKQKCPYQTISPKCNTDLQQKTIKNWKGYVMRISDQRNSMRRFYDHAIQIYVKMQPSERQSKIPDLFLFGSSSTLYDIAEVLDKLGHGDQIVFNATFQKVRGKNTQIQNRYMHIAGLNKTGVRNQSIEVYMSTKEEEYYEKNVEGKALRKQNQQNNK